MTRMCAPFYRTVWAILSHMPSRWVAHGGPPLFSPHELAGFAPTSYRNSAGSAAARFVGTGAGHTCFWLRLKTARPTGVFLGIPQRLNADWERVAAEKYDRLERKSAAFDKAIQLLPGQSAKRTGTRWCSRGSLTKLIELLPSLGMRRPSKRPPAANGRKHLTLWEEPDRGFQNGRGRPIPSGRAHLLSGVTSDCRNGTKKKRRLVSVFCLQPW
jgi:hypothetical protein